MVEKQQSHNLRDEEIDLKEIFSRLWVQKVFIIKISIFSLILACIYLHNADRKFDVTYMLAPVQKAGGGGLKGLGSIQGLASMAGINLPSTSTEDYTSFQFLFHSKEVAELLIDDSDLVKSIFYSEWDSDSKTFKAPKSPFINFLKAVKRTLTGDQRRQYTPPSSGRLAEWMQKNIDIGQDKKTGFLKITSTGTDPNLLAKVMLQATVATDGLFKTRYISTSEQTMAFYREKLSKARASEHREALATLIAQEDQKLILALNGNYFVAQPISAPSTTLYPTSPKSTVVLALSLILGSFLGAVVVLVQKKYSMEVINNA